jgi:endoglucanase
LEANQPALERYSPPMPLACARSTRRVVTAFGPVIVAFALVLLAAASAAARPTMVGVKGNHLTGVNGKPLRLIGVDRSGTEYSCSGPVAGGGFGYAVFQGPADAGSVKALESWRVNAVALPLNEACWLGGYANLNKRFSGRPYRQAIVAYVKLLNAAGIYVVLRLSAAAPGPHAYGSDQISSDEIPMADADHSVAFWSSVASTFASNVRVLFHTYDEPHDVSWKCLRDGCTARDAPEGKLRFGTYRTAGNQAMVNAIRAAGAHQPIIISGPNFASDLSQWVRYMPHDPRHALVADVSSFDYSDYVVSHAPQLRTFAQNHPVIVGGFGDTHCVSTYSTKVMDIMDSIKQSYLAWTWDTVQDYGGCANALLDDPGPQRNGFPAGYYTGRPSGYGAGVRRHFRQIRP